MNNKDVALHSFLLVHSLFEFRPLGTRAIKKLARYTTDSFLVLP